MTFTDLDAANIGGTPLGVPLHPAQAYESIVCAVLFVILIRLLRRKRFDGEVILRVHGCVPIAWFVLEFFRGVADRGFVVGWVSTSQLIAAILGPAAIALLLIKSRWLTRAWT